MKSENGSDNQTHFGYQNVESNKKEQLVANVFHSVAAKYDIMNDVMSFGVHRLWKRFTIDAANVRPGNKILDLAGGTGDLTKLLREITLVSENEEIQERFRLWSNAWWGGAIVFLLAVYWVSRKVLGLI